MHGHRYVPTGQGDTASERSKPLLAGWHRREARRLEASRQGSAAAWHLNRVAELQPHDPSIAVNLAAAYESAADWNQVERAASLAIAAGSHDLETVVRRGWAQIYLGRPAQAAADFRQALEREPGSAAFRLGLFLSAAELGDLALATSQWRLLIDDLDGPRIADRWNTISAHLSRLAKSRPEAWWFWRAHGYSSMRLGHPDQAETYYDKAIALKPNDGWSWLGRGLARKNRNRAEEALADLAQCAKLEPNVPAGWAASGEILGSLEALGRSGPRI